jgi:hypothetical protein
MTIPVPPDPSRLLENGARRYRLHDPNRRCQRFERSRLLWLPVHSRYVWAPNWLMWPRSGAKTQRRSWLLPRTGRDRKSRPAKPHDSVPRCGNVSVTHHIGAHKLVFRTVVQALLRRRTTCEVTSASCSLGTYWRHVFVAAFRAVMESFHRRHRGSAVRAVGNFGNAVHITKASTRTLFCSEIKAFSAPVRPYSCASLYVFGGSSAILLVVLGYG